MNRRSILINTIVEYTTKLDTNIKYIEKYVDFCITNDLGGKQRGYSSTHHILPQSKHLPFAKFKNLRKHAWNKAELKHSHHYYAHYLLAKAINHISTLTAFCGMHKKDIALNRLTEFDLIADDEFQTLYQDRNNKIKQYRLSLVEVDGILITKAKQIYQQTDWSNARRLSSIRFTINNPAHNPEVINKIRNTKSSSIVNGKNMDTIGAERAAKTMKEEFINVDGSISTIYKENGQKISQTVTTKFTDKNGHITSIAKQRGDFRSAQYFNNAPMMCIVKSVLDSTFTQLMTVNEARRTICANICEKTKDEYLGKHANAKRKLIKNNKERFIGLYAEKLSVTHNNHNQGLDHTLIQ